MTDKLRTTIWLVDVATGQQRPLVAGNGSYSSPRWSPDGDRLAYVAADGGAPQLYVRWIANGESARITGLPDSPDSIAWSPDGRRIAYSMFIPDDGPRLGSAPPQARGRQMGRAAARSSTPSPTAPTAPAISSPATTNCSGSRPTAARRPS